MAYDPFFGANPIVNDMEQVRARREQTRENQARLAYSYSTIDTTGAGRILVPKGMMFDCTFVEMPRISYGYYCDGDQFVGTTYPGSTGGVFRWMTDRFGFYIGAWVFVVITGGNYKIKHDFTFSGIAYKDLPAHLVDQQTG